MALIVKRRDGARDALVSVLTTNGLAVEVASSGRQGLHKADLLSPDIILVDLDGLGHDALEVIQSLRDSVLTREMPVVALAKTPASREAAADCNVVVSQPAVSTELIEAIESARRRQTVSRRQR